MHMVHMRTYARGVAAAAAVVSLTLATGCSSGGASGGSNKTRGATITVALGSEPPPKASLDAFTKQTGIKVKWVTLDWDSLQTKISAAASSKTFFADATDVDWSRVGQLGKLGWFQPLESKLDTKAMGKDMPQLTSFTSGGHVVGIPYDASFMVTTVNKKMFGTAGIKQMPTTLDAYTQDLQTIKQKGVAKYPLNIPFAAAEGLSTYWYQTTGAMGGTILDGKGKPQFSDPSSPGYQAAEWMVNALKNGLVPPGNINVTDSQGQQTLMAKGQVASTFSDYSGNVGSLYELPDASSVVHQVGYLATPGTSGAGPNLSNPDGIGIPREAHYPAAAAKFIQWFTATQNQVDFAGVNGPAKALKNYNMPSRVSALGEMTAKGRLVAGAQLTSMLKNSSRPVFPDGAPSWYPEFSRSAYTNLHAAATGSKSVDAAIKAMADTADHLSSDS
jgi:ABC-type glycerol-3-phosphate transport system substrate-binding protein